MACLYTRSEHRHDEAQPRSATVRLLMRHLAPVLRNRLLMAAAVRLMIGAPGSTIIELIVIPSSARHRCAISSGQPGWHLREMS